MDFSLRKSDSCRSLNRIKTLLKIDSPCYCVRSLFLQYADQNFIHNFAWNEQFCLPLGKIKIGWF